MQRHLDQFSPPHPGIRTFPASPAAVTGHLAFLDCPRAPSASQVDGSPEHHLFSGLPWHVMPCLPGAAQQGSGPLTPPERVLHKYQAGLCPPGLGGEAPLLGLPASSICSSGLWGTASDGWESEESVGLLQAGVMQPHAWSLPGCESLATVQGGSGGYLGTGVREEGGACTTCFPQSTTPHDRPSITALHKVTCATLHHAREQCTVRWNASPRSSLLAHATPSNAAPSNAKRHNATPSNTALSNAR